MSDFHSRKKCWQIGFCWQIGVWQIGGCTVLLLYICHIYYICFILISRSSSIFFEILTFFKNYTIQNSPRSKIYRVKNHIILWQKISPCRQKFSDLLLYTLILYSIILWIYLEILSLDYRTCLRIVVRPSNFDHGDFNLFDDNEHIILNIYIMYIFISLYLFINHWKITVCLNFRISLITEQSEKASPGNKFISSSLFSPSKSLEFPSTADIKSFLLFMISLLYTLKISLFEIFGSIKAHWLRLSKSYLSEKIELPLREKFWESFRSSTVYCSINPLRLSEG